MKGPYEDRVHDLSDVSTALRPTELRDLLNVFRNHAASQTPKIN